MADRLESLFEEMDQIRRAGKISDAEFLGFGLLILLAGRRADALQSFGAPRAKDKGAGSTSSGIFTITDFLPLISKHGLDFPGQARRLATPISLSEFLAAVRFRGIPDSARLALASWIDGSYPLALYFHIPPAEEVFALQRQGGRCITFFKQARDLTQLHHGRDAISFIIHDLIHAHEFYSRPERARQQIGFYHWLAEFRKQPLLQAYLAASEAFRAQWEYVIADMNSYCGHLLKTLQAAVAIHFPNPDGRSAWENLIAESTLPSPAKKVFLKVNTDAWTDLDFKSAEMVFEKFAADADLGPAAGPSP